MKINIITNDRQFGLVLMHNNSEHVWTVWVCLQVLLMVCTNRFLNLYYKHHL